jgi:AcrR family transcriptional regulator
MSTETPDASGTLQRLWGVQAGGRRGPKPALSVDRILDAAAVLADAEGLQAVSMAKIADSLGFSPMALYRHVSNKDELLVLLADRIAGDVPVLRADAGWREGLRLWMRAQIEMIVARPWFLELPLSAILPGPRRMRWIDQAFAVMAPLDLGFEEKLGIVGILSEHVLGAARVEVESRRTASATLRASGAVAADVPDDQIDPAALAAANPYAGFETVMSELADPERFPHIFASLAGWEPSAQPPPPDPDGGIEFGLEVVLDGIEAYVGRHTGS